jgi:hypothetical protein
MRAKHFNNIMHLFYVDSIRSHLLFTSRAFFFSTHNAITYQIYAARFIYDDVGCTAAASKSEREKSARN